jgi:hypothetical protein
LDELYSRKFDSSKVQGNYEFLACPPETQKVHTQPPTPHPQPPELQNVRNFQQQQSLCETFPPKCTRNEQISAMLEIQ